MTSLMQSSLTVLRGVRPVAFPVMAVFWTVHTGLLLGFRTPEFRGATRAIEATTNGLVQHTLVANLIVALVLIVLGLLGMGYLRRRDLGIKRGWALGWQILNAVLVTYLVWAVMHLGTALAGHWTDALLWHPGWDRFVNLYSTAVGTSLAALFGSALVEELTYRAFLLPQVYLALTRWDVPRRHRLWSALLISQTIFGLNHIPAGLDYGFSGGTLVLYLIQVTGVGIIFAALYLQTGNLLIAVGMHALINAPVSVYQTPLDPQFAALLTVLGLVLAWPVLAGWMGHIFTAQRLHALGRIARRSRSSNSPHSSNPS